MQAIFYVKFRLIIPKGMILGSQWLCQESISPTILALHKIKYVHIQLSYMCTDYIDTVSLPFNSILNKGQIIITEQLSFHEPALIGRENKSWKIVVLYILESFEVISIKNMNLTNLKQNDNKVKRIFNKHAFLTIQC